MHSEERTDAGPKGGPGGAIEDAGPKGGPGGSEDPIPEASED